MPNFGMLQLKDAARIVILDRTILAFHRRKRKSWQAEGTENCESLHPGVEALGYVNNTTPFLLSSTSFFKVIFSPSWVSICPPNPSRSTISPVAALLAAILAGSEDLALLLPEEALIELAFFTGGGSAESVVALRFRNSTMSVICCKEDASTITDFDGALGLSRTNRSVGGLGSH